MFERYESAKSLFQEAESRGLRPVWRTADGLFSFPNRGKNVFVYYTKLHINSQLGSWICQDKHLTRQFLETERYPNIPYCYSKKPSHINSFFDKYQPIIQKPVLGMKSESVRRIQERADIDFASLEESIFEQYIEGTEYRCFVLRGKTVAMQRKDIDPTESHPWRKHCTNVEQSEWNPNIISVASSVSSALHMGCLAVDFIIDAKGEARILELNGMPAFHFFHHPHSGKAVPIAALVLDAILES